MALLAFIGCAVATPPGAWLTYAALAALLAGAAIFAGAPPRRLLGRLLLVSPVLAMVALSAVVERPADGADALAWRAFGHPLSAGALERAGSIVVSAGLSVVAATVASTLTGPERLARGLASFGLPRLLVALLAMTIRYLSVGEDETRRMVRARDARGVPPRLRDRVRVAGAMVGSLFVRSLDRAERVGSAMAARGFDGSLPMLRRGPVRGREWLAAGCFGAACILATVLLGGVV